MAAWDRGPHWAQAHTACDGTGAVCDVTERAELCPIGVSDHVRDEIPLTISPVLLNDWLMTLMTAGGVRLAIRTLNEPPPGRRRKTDRLSRRILIVGAGAAGTMVAREISRNPQLRMDPIGFLDDDLAKVNHRVA